TDFPTTIAAAAINSYDINETSCYESKSIKTEILPVLSDHNRLKQAKRLPGLPSSNFGLEILMGKDETIDFEISS
ncbi:4071_t:CDS:2, partial [Racocetra persica]